MDIILLLKAAVIGLSIAAPVGPIGLLCMQRTLNGGLKVGFASGLGAASADTIYGAIGAFGLTAITQLFTSMATPLAILGGGFLIWMGIQLLRTQVQKTTSSSTSSVSIFKSFISTLALTLANPMTIVSFIAVFSALSASVTLSYDSATTMIIGIFIGSAIWWLMLSGLVSLIRHKITALFMCRINKCAAVVLLAFGFWQLLREAMNYYYA
ncbi:MAG: lysine exporter protein LysE/YggA [Osedax symbiont Rs2]|nr:MAG: lysine exporter protein LysE/YggA [Osedax symbiont Rs2]